MSQKNKKITLLISSLVGGGAEGVCVNVANGLADRGWNVDLLVLNTNNAAYLDRVSQKVNLVVLGVSRARNSLLQILRYIKQNKPEKILVFNYEMAVITIILRSLFRFKTKIIARNINTFSKNISQRDSVWRHYVVKPLIERFYGKCDHIINQCHAMRKDLISVFPYLEDRSSVIYNPIAKHVEEYAEAYNLSKVDKQDYLLCVGRLEKQKAFHYAIEGFACVADDYPNLRLKIVGQGSLIQSLEQYARDFGVADRVDFEGFQSNILPYYLYAKATILTSLYEGFPNVLLESIALGTPIISFNCPSGPNEIVCDNKNGLIVDEGNVKLLSESIKTLLNNLENFNVKNVQETSTRFSRENILNEWEKLLSANEQRAVKAGGKFDL